jgi:GTP-binding protein LepA
MGKLMAGDVGYICASIKNMRDTHVGDTITLATIRQGAASRIQEGCPDGVLRHLSRRWIKYGDLRDALEKLQLNDAALLFEPETSVALGFGFRCGFLGLLHMEIIQERLEREYNMDLVTTAPSVIYKITKTDGTAFELDNPSKLPDVAEIESMQEPMVKVTIMSPTEYVGNIMELCQDRRGTYVSMEYMEATRSSCTM